MIQEAHRHEIKSISQSTTNNDGIKKKSGWFLWIGSIWFCGCAARCDCCCCSTPQFIAMVCFPFVDYYCFISAFFVFIACFEPNAMHDDRYVYRAALIFEITNSQCHKTKQVCEITLFSFLFLFFFLCVFFLFVCFKSEVSYSHCLVAQSSRLHSRVLSVFHHHTYKAIGSFHIFLSSNVLRHSTESVRVFSFSFLKCLAF